MDRSQNHVFGGKSDGTNGSKLCKFSGNIQGGYRPTPAYVSKSEFSLSSSGILSKCLLQPTFTSSVDFIKLPICS